MEITKPEWDNLSVGYYEVVMKYGSEDIAQTSFEKLLSEAKTTIKVEPSTFQENATVSISVAPSLINKTSELVLYKIYRGTNYRDFIESSNVDLLNSEIEFSMPDWDNLSGGYYLAELNVDGVLVADFAFEKIQSSVDFNLRVCYPVVYGTNVMFDINDQSQIGKVASFKIFTSTGIVLAQFQGYDKIYNGTNYRYIDLGNLAQGSYSLVMYIDGVVVDNISFYKQLSY